MKKLIYIFLITTLLTNCGVKNSQQNSKETDSTAINQEVTSTFPKASWTKPLFALNESNDTIIKWIYNDKGLLIKKIIVNKACEKTDEIEFSYEYNKIIYSSENNDVFDDWDIYHCYWGMYDGDKMIDEYSDNTFTKLISVNGQEVKYDEQGRITKIGDSFTYIYTEEDGAKVIEIDYTFCDFVKFDKQGRIIYRDNTANYPSESYTEYAYTDNVITITHTETFIGRDENGMIDGDGESDAEKKIMFVHF